jgi:hypothetical protein
MSKIAATAQTSTGVTRSLGLGTSPTSLLRIGWRHIGVVRGTTCILLVVVTVGLTLR